MDWLQNYSTCYCFKELFGQYYQYFVSIVSLCERNWYSNVTNTNTQEHTCIVYLWLCMYPTYCRFIVLEFSLLILVFIKSCTVHLKVMLFKHVWFQSAVGLNSISSKMPPICMTNLHSFAWPGNYIIEALMSTKQAETFNVKWRDVMISTLTAKT